MDLDDLLEEFKEEVKPQQSKSKETWGAESPTNYQRV